MKSIVRDVLILVSICAAVWAITRVRLHSRQLERNRAELVYTTDIDDETARQLMDALQLQGFLNGIPRTFQIAKVDDIFELRVVTQPGSWQIRRPRSCCEKDLERSASQFLAANKQW